MGVGGAETAALKRCMATAAANVTAEAAAAEAAAAAAALACNRVLCMAGPWPETALTVKRQRCSATPQCRGRRWPI